MHPAETLTSPTSSRSSHPQQLWALRDTLRFDWLMTGLIVWLSFGTLLDGWAHNTRSDLDTFFTPWHLVMYAGILAVTSFTVGVVTYNVSQGIPWTRALPVGYLPSLVGIGIFLASGIGDLIWHALFGIESNVEALLSPTHLGLALGVVLIVAGPLRAAARRPQTRLTSWLEVVPVLLSATLTLTALTYMTQFSNPLGLSGAATDYRAEHGRVSVGLDIAGMVLHAVLVVGTLLLVTRRWHLPRGSITCIVTLNATLMILVCYDTLAPHPLVLMLAAFLSAAGAELIVHRCRLASPMARMRALSVSVPVLFSLGYYITLMIWGGGIWWSVHLWTGTVVLAGLAGLLASYLVVPPQGLEASLDESTEASGRSTN